MGEPVLSIDLNSDMGEGDAATDRALLDIVTSANIACGGHAGDDASMKATVEAALIRGVAIGAHPSYPDRPGFGRVEMNLAPAAIEAAVAEQVTALNRIVRPLGAHLSHIKPHGALYHAAMKRPEVAAAIAVGVRRAVGDLFLIGMAGCPGMEWWIEQGLRTGAEGFADRAYEADGTLRSRTKPGAVHENPAKAAEQARRIVEGQGVLAPDGSVVQVRAETLCIHGDTPGAATVAKAVRAALEAAGISVRRL